MTEQEKRTEAIWTYVISREKVLHRLVNKGSLAQEDADLFLQRMYNELNADEIPGARISPLKEKMQNPAVNENAYVSLTDIAKRKVDVSPSYLIQSWMRSGNTTDYLKTWEKEHNPSFQEKACDALLMKAHSSSVTLTPTLWIKTTSARGIVTSRGKGGGTMAHPEIAIAFQAWLFPEFMMELVKWYRLFQHEDKDN